MIWNLLFGLLGLVGALAGKHRPLGLPRVRSSTPGPRCSEATSASSLARPEPPAWFEQLTRKLFRCVGVFEKAVMDCGESRAPILPLGMHPLLGVNAAGLLLMKPPLLPSRSVADVGVTCKDSGNCSSPSS